MDDPQKEDAPPLVIRLFGDFAVEHSGRPVTALKVRKEKWLLALLVLAQGRAVSRAWLAQTLWPFPETLESQSAYNVRRSLSGLRKALGEAADCLLAPDSHTLALNPATVDADVIAFDRAVVRGDRKSLERALAFYRGPLLPECTETWVLTEREARSQAYRNALENVAAYALAEGDFAGAARLLRRAILIEPLWEAAYRTLMEALAKQGDATGALQVYQELIAVLRRDSPKALPHPETAALSQRLLTEAQRRARPLPRSPEAEAIRARGRLPQPLTELIGREEDRIEVSSRLRTHRLVTLTGTGGIGKTRLAIAVGHDLANTFSGGAGFVELAAVSDPRFLIRAISASLETREESGKTPQESLVRALHNRSLLLILDNCEHLLAACAALADTLLRECPGVRILATSRQPLGLPGEIAWRVPSLAFLDPAHLSAGQKERVDALREYAAIRLFVERAEAANQSFRLTGANALAVATLCSRLDGIPLALQLAATRVKALTAHQIAERLDDCYALLTGGSGVLPRQQTLRAAMEWSEALLSEAERTVLMRLACFAGGWTLEACEAVCADIRGKASDVLDILTGLTDKSLVMFDTAEGEGRFHLLETIRQYAAERLRQNGDAQRMRLLHRDYYLAFAERVNPHLNGPQQREWLDRLECERDNLRAALDCCLEDPEGAKPGLRLAGALHPFWWSRSYLSEGREYMAAVLSRPEAQGEVQGRAEALNGAGILARMEGRFSDALGFHEQAVALQRAQNRGPRLVALLSNLGGVLIHLREFEQAHACLEESLSLAREQNLVQATAATLAHMGLLAMFEGDLEGARRYSEQCLQPYRDLRDRVGLTGPLLVLAMVASRQDDMDRSIGYFEEIVSIFRENGNVFSLAQALCNLGLTHIRQGTYDRARPYLAESIRLYRAQGELRRIAWTLAANADLAHGEQRLTRAVRLYGAANALRESIDSTLLTPPDSEQKTTMNNLSVALGQEAFEAAIAAGRSLNWEQAIAYALSDQD